MAVDVRTDKGISAGLPHRLFVAKEIAMSSYDVLPDGRRFILSTRPKGTMETVITVVLNWWAELKN